MKDSSAPPTTLMPIEPPVRVLSDLHLGHPASYLRQPEMVLPLLGSGTRTVVFNGDTCELSNLKRKKDSLAKLRRLAELCYDQGVSPIFLPGNHDPHISSAHFLDPFDGKVFITHGDVVHRRIAPWSSDAAALWAERNRLLMEEPEPLTLEELHLLIKHCVQIATIYDPEVKTGFLARLELVSRFARHPWRVPRLLLYWASIVHNSRQLLERFRPDARLMIIGHTHRPGVWPNPDFTLINTGSFQPLSRALLVQLDEKQVSVHKTVRDQSGYHLGRQVYHRVL